jgi:heat-inducible transcriptional repressor
LTAFGALRQNLYVSPISKRARQVLYAVVTEFIATGEPVGSRTLTKKYGFSLSPATIRNVLADLEDEGYLTRPHSSSGRKPTDAAFRLFVDALMQVRRLPPNDAGRITEWLDGLRPDSDLVRETGKLLSDLSGAPAVVLRRRSETRTLLKIRFIATRAGEMLAVVVFSDSSVENRFIRVDKAVTDSEIERVHEMLEEIVEGRTLTAVREEVARGLRDRRDELATLHDLGYLLLRSATDASPRFADVVIQGQTLLLDTPEFANVDRARDLLLALEDRERLVGLLDRVLNSERVEIFLGEETSSAVGYPVSLVASRFSERGQPSGAVGVLGPTRMDYPLVVPLVAAAADAISTAIARHQDANAESAAEAPSDSERPR